MVANFIKFRVKHTDNTQELFVVNPRYVRTVILHNEGGKWILDIYVSSDLGRENKIRIPLQNEEEGLRLIERYFGPTVNNEVYEW